MGSKNRENKSYDFKRIHLYGVMWFLVCLIFLVVVAIDRIGFHWWVVFSASGYSTILALFLAVVYLFAIYKGVIRNSNSIEHPLTTSPYYVLLYESAPFIGVLAGLSVVSFSQPLLSLFIGAAQGTVIMTIMMWIIIDTLVDLIEGSFPRSATHRKRRLAENQRKKQAQLLERQKMLEQISRQEKQTQSRWRYLFQPYAAEVADLLCNRSADMGYAKKRIAELGAMAWMQGEHLGMTFFHKIIMGELKSRADRPSVDFVALYWSGIGTWKNPSVVTHTFV